MAPSAAEATNNSMQMYFEASTDHSESGDPYAGRDEESIERLEEEISQLNDSVHGLDAYHIVDKLGEGTFSSVYKAIDVHHAMFANAEWFKTNTPHIAPRPARHPTVYVALKRIYVTSSTARILNELEIMESLRGAPFISYLVTAFRSADQVIAVMPYTRHAEFREYYRVMPLSDLPCYFYCLFSALEAMHSRASCTATSSQLISCTIPALDTAHSATLGWQNGSTHPTGTASAIIPSRRLSILMACRVSTMRRRVRIYSQAEPWRGQTTSRMSHGQRQALRWDRPTESATCAMIRGRVSARIGLARAAFVPPKCY